MMAMVSLPLLVPVGLAWSSLRVVWRVEQEQRRLLILAPS